MFEWFAAAGSCRSENHTVIFTLNLKVQYHLLHLTLAFVCSRFLKLLTPYPVSSLDTPGGRAQFYFWHSVHGCKSWHKY